MPVVDRERRLPGDEGVWFFISVDIIFFALLFGTYSYERSLNTTLFDNAQQLLHSPIAAVNTVFLLTSSLLVALGVRAFREHHVLSARRYLAAASCFGIAFIVTKMAEFGIDINDGLQIITNEFFMFYFFITGLHLLHVIGGSVVLLLARNRMRHSAATASDLSFVESGASFWHMVDLLWLLIFPLLYLLR